jgi:CCR4-NOT transcription complex subunit 1
VSNVPQGAAVVIKNYLQSLGSFIGALTVAKNEPVRSLHLDLKQILVEGFQVKNRKLAVTFVCRILKESQQSRVFNLRNPWMSTLLSILREMHNLSSINSPGQPNIPNSTEYLPEIDLLFKTLNVQNLAIIKPHGILENLQNPNSFLN